MHRFDSPRFFRPLISPQICISTQIQYFRWLARIIARGIATLGKGTTQKEVLRDNRTVDPQLFFTGFRIQPRQPLTTITNYGITGIDCTILGHQPSIKLRDIRLNDNMPSADNKADFNISGTWDNGWIFNNKLTNPDATIYFPALGERFDFGGSLYFMGINGCYWSALPYSTGNGCNLLFSQEAVYTQAGYTRPCAFSVRPVAE